MLRIVALAGVALAALATRAVADPRSIALSDALAGVSASPAHQVSEAQRREAAATLAAAGAWPATTLQVSTTRATARLDVIAGIPLPVFGTLDANRAVASEALAVTVADLRVGDLHLAQDIATAWFALARAEAHAEASKKNAEREGELVHAASERFAAGDASHADVVLATAAAKRLAARAAADIGAIEVASADLAATLGWDPAQRLHATGGLPAVPERAPAVVVHPEAVAASQRVIAERARVTEASRTRWPRLALDLESAISDPSLPGTDYRIGISAELPLFGHGDRLVRAAEARVATAQIEGARTGTRLDAALARARARFATAAQLAASLATDALPVQREAAELSRVAYREGQTGIVVMLEAERALADAEIEAIDARADAGVAYVELAWASGTAP